MCLSVVFGSRKHESDDCFVKLLILYLNPRLVPTTGLESVGQTVCLLHISAPALEHSASCFKANDAQRSAVYVFLVNIESILPYAALFLRSSP